MQSSSHVQEIKPNLSLKKEEETTRSRPIYTVQCTLIKQMMHKFLWVGRKLCTQGTSELSEPTRRSRVGFGQNSEVPRVHKSYRPTNKTCASSVL